MAIKVSNVTVINNDRSIINIPSANVTGNITANNITVPTINNGTIITGTGAINLAVNSTNSRGSVTFGNTNVTKGAIWAGTDSLIWGYGANWANNLALQVNAITGVLTVLTSVTTSGTSATPIELSRLTNAQNVNISFEHSAAKQYFGIDSTGLIRVGSSNDLNSTGNKIFHEGFNGIGAGIDSELFRGMNQHGVSSRVISTPTTTGTTSNQWFKFATATIGNRFHDVNVVLNWLSGRATGFLIGNHVTHLRVRQTSVFGSDPEVNLYSFRWISQLMEFGYVIVSNAGPTVVEFYAKINGSTLDFNAFQEISTNYSTGTIDYTLGSFLETPPAGLVIVTDRRLLTTNDEGAGQGLDADTIDGLDSTQFLRSDINSTTNGIISFTRPNTSDFAGGATGTKQISFTTNAAYIHFDTLTGPAGFGWGSDLTSTATAGGTMVWRSGNNQLNIEKHNATTLFSVDFDNGQVSIPNTSTTIGGTNFNGGHLIIGNNTLGISLDSNEIFAATDLTIGTFSGDLNFNPFGIAKIKGDRIYTTSYHPDSDAVSGFPIADIPHRVGFTSNTSNTSNGQYTKIATVTLNVRYADYNGVWDLLLNGSGISNFRSAEAHVRIKQQNDFGGNPAIECKLYSWISPDIELHYSIVSNAGPTVVDLYLKINSTFTVVDIFERVSDEITNRVFHTSDSFTTTPPANLQPASVFRKQTDSSVSSTLVNYQSLNTTTVTEGYSYRYRSSTNAVAYFNQRSTGDIARFFKGDFNNSSEGPAQVTITNAGGITTTAGISAPSVTTGGILLNDAPGRTGLLQVAQLASHGYSGIQITRTLGNQWSVMGSETAFGLYDDEQNMWLVLHNKNAGTSIYYNGAEKLKTVSSGVDITGTISATGYVRCAHGGGGVALSTNDGQGNANVTFNHLGGTPDNNGNSARIVVNTDSVTDANIQFEVISNVTSGVYVDTTHVFTLYETYSKVPDNYEVRFGTDTDYRMYFNGASMLMGGLSNGVNVIHNGYNNSGVLSATIVETYNLADPYVYLNCSGVKRAETTTTGFSITGNLDVAGNQLTPTDARLAAPAAEPTTLANSQVSFWVDEVSDLLMFKVQYSNGTVKSASLALT